MPSARRLRLLLVVALAVVVTTLFFTSQWRATSERDPRTLQDFIGKTVNAMDKTRGTGGSQIVMSGKEKVVNGAKDKDGDGSIDEDDKQMAEEMAERLRAAEKKAKDLANEKAPLKPDSPSEIVGVGSSAGGQKKIKGSTEASETEEKEETPEEHELELIMNDIFKKSPGKPAENILVSSSCTDFYPQSLSSQKHTAPFPNEPRVSSLRSTRSSPHHMSSNSMSILWVRSYRTNLQR